MQNIKLPPWIPNLLRYVIIGLVVPPAFGKFLTYHRSTRLFDTLGLPMPEVTVIVVGALELSAVILLLLDRHRKGAGLLVGPIMIVATWTTGEWQALTVLLALVGLFATDIDVLRVDSTTTDPDRPAGP